jgi:hypothetical protein
MATALIHSTSTNNTYVLLTSSFLLLLTSSCESYCGAALMSVASPRMDLVRFMLLIVLMVVFWLCETSDFVLWVKKLQKGVATKLSQKHFEWSGSPKTLMFLTRKSKSVATKLSCFSSCCPKTLMFIRARRVYLTKICGMLITETCLLWLWKWKVCIRDRKCPKLASADSYDLVDWVLVWSSNGAIVVKSRMRVLNFGRNGTPLFGNV